MRRIGAPRGTQGPHYPGISAKSESARMHNLRPVIGGSAYRTVGSVGDGAHRQESVSVEAGCEGLVLSCLHYRGVGHHLAHLELISHLSARTSRTAHHAFSETRAPHPPCHSSGGGRTMAHHSGALPALKVWCTMKKVDILETCKTERSGLRRSSLGAWHVC